MKNSFLTLLLFISISAFSQHKDRERIKALKVSFITEKLELTEKEAQQFWPVYNEYESNTYRLKYKDNRSLRKDMKDNIDSMSEAEAKDLINKIGETEKHLYELRMEFPKKLSKIISSKKILQLKIAEEDFKKKMLDELRKQRRNKN